MTIPLGQAFGAAGKIDQGSNGSEDLANLGGQVFIGIPKTKRVLSFKAFISDFKRSSESEYEEAAFSVTDSPRVIKGTVKNKINLTLDVTSQSINEARINLQKVQELCRFFITDTSDLDKFVHNPDRFVVYVKFSNLISNEASQVSSGLVRNYQDVTFFGSECIFQNFSFEIDVESGFFEGGPGDARDVGKLIPKKMSITLELVPRVVTTLGDSFVSFDDPDTSIDIKIDRYITRFTSSNNAVDKPFGIDYNNPLDDESGDDE